MEIYKPAIISGSIIAMLAVIIGAFGAHKLKEMMEPSLLESFETGVRYQFYHAFALIIVGILYYFIPSKNLVYAHWAFLIGIILFSGSIYFLTINKATSQIGLGKFGLITPIGGLSFIIGWIMLILGVIRK